MKDPRAGAERSLLRYRFAENLTVAQIARRLDLDPKATYRRFKKISARLKRFLDERGVTYEKANELTGRASNEIIVRY